MASITLQRPESVSGDAKRSIKVMHGSWTIGVIHVSPKSFDAMGAEPVRTTDFGFDGKKQPIHYARHGRKSGVIFHSFKGHFSLPVELDVTDETITAKTSVRGLRLKVC
jgi:hypothetical protein